MNKFSSKNLTTLILLAAVLGGAIGAWYQSAKASPGTAPQVHFLTGGLAIYYPDQQQAYIFYQGMGGQGQFVDCQIWKINDRGQPPTAEKCK